MKNIRRLLLSVWVPVMVGLVVTIKLPLRFAEPEEMIKESGDMP